MQHKNDFKNYFKIASLIICIFSVCTIQITCASDNRSKTGEYITINPVGDHFVGDTIVFNGSVNISGTKQLLFEIQSANFYPRAKIEAGKNNGSVAVIDFQNNTWSYMLNTTNWIPDEYYAGVYPIRSGNIIIADTPFNLAEKISEGRPSQNSPISMTPTTTLRPTVSQKTPLSFFIPIIAVGILFSLGIIRYKMRTNK